MVAYCWLIGCFAYFRIPIEVVPMSILIYFATIFWSLFPNLIHVFQGGENYVIKVNETNLVVNGDLTLDSNSDAIPDGFTYSDDNTTSKTLVDGVATFTPTSQFAHIRTTNLSIFNNIDTYYTFAYVKSDSNKVGLHLAFSVKYHTGSNDFEFLSGINVYSNVALITQVVDYGITGFTPISVDYIGAYNISLMKNNGVKNDEGILFSDLSNEEIRLQLDEWINKNGQLTFKIDNTYDKWFNTGFVEKTAERDFIDYLGYFFWLATPPIMLFITLDLIRRFL